MSLLESEAVTLRTYPYSESHRIAVFLTPDFGQLRGVAHGARRSRSRFGACLEPMTVSRVVFSRKENQDLCVLRSAEILEAFPVHRLSLEVQLHFSYFAELLQSFSQAEQDATRQFRLIRSLLRSIQTVPIELLSRYLELWLLRLEGVLPDLGPHLGGDLAERTMKMLAMPPAELSPLTLKSGEAKRLERTAQELIECHLEKRLKSCAMLRQLL